MFKFNTKDIILSFNMDNDYQRRWYEFLTNLEDRSSKRHSKKKFILSALEHEVERLKADGIDDVAKLRRYCKGMKVENNGISYRNLPVSVPGSSNSTAPVSSSKFPIISKDRVTPEEMAKYKEVQAAADNAGVTLEFADVREFAEFYRQHPEDIEGFLAGDLESGLMESDEAEEEFIDFPEPDTLIRAKYEATHPQQ